MNRKYVQRPFLNILEKAFEFFRNFIYSDEFATQKIVSGYYKFSLHGSEGFNKIFGFALPEKLVAVKIEVNCF